MAKKPTVAFILSLIGTTLIILNASSIMGIGVGVGVVIGAIILPGASMINSESKREVDSGSIIFLFFSILGLNILFSLILLFQGITGMNSNDRLTNTLFVTSGAKSYIARIDVKRNYKELFYLHSLFL